MGGGRALRLVRRVLALWLTLVAVWMVSLTVKPPRLSAFFTGLGEDSEFVVGTMSAQLGWTGVEEGVTASLDGWGRLLLSQSVLLEEAAPAVEEYLRSRKEVPQIQEEADDESQQEPLLQPIPDGAVVEHTGVGADDGSFLSAEQVYVKNTTQETVDVAALAAQTVKLEMGDGPQILIYHTHGSEAYTQTEESRYVESDAYRTTDCTRNVVQVGEEMARVLREMGFEVIHDTTLYDYPVYNEAYTRARAGVQKWLEQYPGISLVLDVHRDALVSADGAAYKLIAREGEEKVAQVMLVMGSDDSGAEHPNWRENLALAVQVQLELTRDFTQLARPITLRESRFNQDLSTGALLVEVGGHGNTLEEAVSGGRLFAQTVGELLKEMKTK